MKKIITAICLFALIFLLSGLTAMAEQTQIGVTVNGQELSFDQSPVNENGTVFVPLRGIFEAFEQTVSYDEKEKYAQLMDPVTGMKTVIAMDSAVVKTTQNNVERSYIMSAAPLIKNGRILVPVRAVSDIFGKDVNWNQREKTVHIKDAESTLDLSGNSTYEGYLGDIVRIKVTEDDTYTYVPQSNQDFIYLRKEAVGVGNYNLYFKAVTITPYTSITLDKKDKATKKTGDSLIYKAKLSDPDEIAFTLKSDEKNAVKVGDYCKVSLPEQNASTGYDWYAAVPNGLRLIEEKSLVSQSQLIGAPSQTVFVFQVMEQNEAMTLRFDKKRPWEVSPIETVLYELTTTEDFHL